MNELLQTTVTALSVALLNFLWQGALIGALAGLALAALKNARPQARYAVACAALLACVLAVVITLVSAWPSASAGTLAGASRTSVPLTAKTLALATTDSTLAPWLVALWASGSGLLFARMALGLVAIRRMRLQPAAPAEWQARLDQLGASLGLGKIALLLGDGLGSPLAAGWWRPFVLLPAGLLTRLPVAQVEALLAHELAHIRRHDYLINLIQVTIEALLFFHPVVWWLSARIRHERELIADQLAVEATSASRPLAQALAALAELQAIDAGALALAGSGGALKARIRALVRPEPRPLRVASTVLTLLGLTASALGLLACSQVQQHTRDASTTKPRLSYALVRSDVTGILAWGPDDEIDSVARALPPRAGDYVLVRRNGRDALVTDSTTVAALRRNWEAAERLELHASAQHAELQQKHQSAQVLAEQIEAGDESDVTVQKWQHAARELDTLTTRAKQLSRQQYLAYKQVEHQLRDVIATAPTVAL